MKKNSWFRFLILQCCAVTVSVSQLKVSAVMEQVAQGFSISMGAAAGLMSFFTVAGIVLAIPGAALMERMGAKRLLLLLMACLFAGNAVGAVAGAYPLLMAGRLLEGVAYAMIIMVGIDLINTWFPHGGAGTATGIFNTFAAVGNFITLNGAQMECEDAVVDRRGAGGCGSYTGFGVYPSEQRAKRTRWRVHLATAARVKNSAARSGGFDSGGKANSGPKQEPGERW